MHSVHSHEAYLSFLPNDSSTGMHTSRKSVKRRNAAATVEAALVLPILFLMLFGGWEFARINVIRNTMDNAAYTSARESMLPGTTQNKIKAQGQAVLDAVGVTGATISVTPSNITTNTDKVTIDITVPIAQNSLGVAKFFASGNMSASCTLSRELQPGNF